MIIALLFQAIAWFSVPFSSPFWYRHYVRYTISSF